jgi:hypothetical protein
MLFLFLIFSLLVYQKKNIRTRLIIIRTWWRPPEKNMIAPEKDGLASVFVRKSIKQWCVGIEMSILVHFDSVLSFKIIVLPRHSFAEYHLCACGMIFRMARL